LTKAVGDDVVVAGSVVKEKSCDWLSSSVSEGREARFVAAADSDHYHSQNMC
ncbi:Hypothetical predicted protein, partial [Olea europaea subsp. europaea]